MKFVKVQICQGTSDPIWVEQGMSEREVEILKDCLHDDYDQVWEKLVDRLERRFGRLADWFINTIKFD